jgi:S-formylglutathione hydrolase FrmB
MNTYKIILAMSVMFLGLVSGPRALADHYKPVCSSYISTMLQTTIDYCLDRTHPEQPSLPGERVTYFMHGTNGSAATWTSNNYANSLSELRDSGAPLPAMTFVSFSTSAYSFFSDHPGDPHAAWETWFTTEFVPYIENTYQLCNQKQCRSIMGESMGGFGALKTILRHSEMFSSVAVNSPALPAFSVWAPLNQWISFFSQHTVGPIKGWFLIELVRKIFTNETSWQANNPVELSQNLPPAEYPPLYFDMGGKDDYGFNVGYFIFKQVLDQRGIAYTTIFEPNGHHDEWLRHAADSIRFVCAHSADTTLSEN